MKPMFGTPVSGGEFFDRKTLLNELKRNIHHAHHALIGPRGCGKSSVLEQLAAMEQVNNLVPLRIDINKVVPKTQRNVIKTIGKEALYAAVREKGFIRSMPTLAKDKMAKMTDFVRDNLRVKISDWVTLYFDPDADLTEFIENTFSTIESYGIGLLVMLDEVTSIIRISGSKPKDEDMDFFDALRSHISKAKNANYIFCGSQVGLMELLIKAKFGRMLVPKEVGGLEEDGARELVFSKIKQRVPTEFMAELKERTHLWPLYLQAYCLAANVRGGKLDTPADLEADAFGFLRGHFLYLESMVSELELMVLLTLGDGRVSGIASRLGTSYYAVQSALKTLDLKGFVKKLSPGTYAPLDPMFSAWLKREYESPEAWK
ncbi:MAG: hypothetical protein AB1476_03775 [Candidatus Hadarchaeota archaeon]